MSSAELLALLLETALASSAATVVVLALRRRLRQAFGPGPAYAAWLLVPAAILGAMLPAREAAGGAAPLLAAMPAPAAMLAQIGTGLDMAGLLAAGWACGALGVAIRTLGQQRAFGRLLGPLRRRRDGSWQAGTVAGLPAAHGLLRPRIVVPADFDRRYDAAQRALMLLHERIHIRRGDLHVNALAALARCVYWFNPLVHAAARHLRHDQELACDAAVIARHPQRRRAYGEAMFHTQLAAQTLPFGCHWGGSHPANHPLKERIEMLKQNRKSSRRVAAGAAVVCVLAIATGTMVWAAQPERDAAAVAGSSTAASQERPGQEQPDDRSRLVPPRYPKAAVDANVSGRVVLIIDIDATGRPTAIEVERSTPPGVFEASAVEAAWKWRFEPGTEGGRPVASRVRVPVDFEADGDPPADAEA